jgi:hypothetical protein
MSGGVANGEGGPGVFHCVGTKGGPQVRGSRREGIAAISVPKMPAEQHHKQKARSCISESILSIRHIYQTIQIAIADVQSYMQKSILKIKERNKEKSGYFESRHFESINQ